MIASDEQTNSYAQFMADVAEGHVYVSSLGVGAGSADITAIGRHDYQDAYRRHFYQALDAGEVEIDGPRVVLRGGEVRRAGS